MISARDMIDIPTVESYITLPHTVAPMTVNVCAPGSCGPVSAVIVLMFPRSGMDGFPQQVSRGLARNGFVVFAPDITHRIPDTVPVRDRKRLLTDEGIIEDVGGFLSWLDTSEYGSLPRYVMGHCMGGRNALLAASAFHFDAAVSFYGGEMFEAWGGETTPAMRLQNIPCPVLAFFGGKDRNPSPADAARIERELAQAGVEHQFFTYENVGHAFQQNAGRSPEEGHAANDSNEKALAFLHAITQRKSRNLPEVRVPS